VTIVLDSSVVIDLLRGYEPALAYGRSLSELPYCSEITRVEVVRGLRSAERTAADRLFAAIAWVVVDDAVARRAGELGRQWRRSHGGIGSADLIVAATTLLLDAELATLNVKHFPMFEGLAPPYLG
jgi:predicted nucleic acid-binding protein